MTLGRERYEQMLLELGELRKQNQFFMEFKGMLLAKEESIRRLERDVELLGERVRALEMRRPKEPPDAADDLQESAERTRAGKNEAKKTMVAGLTFSTAQPFCSRKGGRPGIRHRKGRA